MKMWITRGRRGVLTLFSQEPVKDRFGRWFGKGESILNFDIPSVTFENSPQEIELKLVEETTRNEITQIVQDKDTCAEAKHAEDFVGVVESPLKTFPRVNIFEVGASYRR